MNNLIYTENCPDNIVSFMTTRIGGYSKNEYSSFNFGIYSDDEHVAVLKNLRLLNKIADINDLVLLKQVHGNIVHEVDFNNAPDIYLSEGDGLFTKEPNLAIGVLTADCYPVHLWSKNAVAILHCGWRSLNSRIIENAMQLFEKNNEKVIGAQIGSGICAECYEVRDDMVDKLDKRYNPASVLKPISEGHYKLDLKKLVANALNINGINKISVSEKSTCCCEEFFSYRRDNSKTGRMVSVIMRRP